MQYGNEKNAKLVELLCDKDIPYPAIVGDLCDNFSLFSKLPPWYWWGLFGSDDFLISLGTFQEELVEIKMRTSVHIMIQIATWRQQL